MDAERSIPDASSPETPSALLEAIAFAGGGRVVVVIGAGCSLEAPTGLPLAGTLAKDCYRRLVADGVLPDDACEDPDDLSAVADAVFAAKASQDELVRRFPPDRFRRAQPNRGHLLTAALMRERAISDVLSLNFDLAPDHALTEVGAREEVATVDGPEDHARLAAQNLVYLHRSISRPSDDLILRTAQLEQEWRDRWEEVVARRIIGGAVTVFVGLGSPAAVLVQTTKKVLESVGDGASVYVVDPMDAEYSAFFQALDLPDRAWPSGGLGSQDSCEGGGAVRGPEPALPLRGELASGIERSASKAAKLAASPSSGQALATTPRRNLGTPVGARR